MYFILSYLVIDTICMCVCFLFVVVLLCSFLYEAFPYSPRFTSDAPGGCCNIYETHTCILS